MVTKDIFDKEHFVRQIRQALQNLHDFAFLQKLALTNALTHDRSSDQAVRLLRAEMLNAIEYLNPGHNSSPRARERRPYALLYGLYVQKMTSSELIDELAISQRQLRREHKRALTTLCDLLWEKLETQLAPHALQNEFEDEVERLISCARYEPIALLPLIEDVLTLFKIVAAHRHIHLLNQLPSTLPSIAGDRVVVRQALLKMLTSAAEQITSGTITLSARADDLVSIEALLSGTAVGKDRPCIVSELLRLVEGTGGCIGVYAVESGWCYRLEFPPLHKFEIVVMDDNSGLVELFRRYLNSDHYHMQEAQTADQAIAMINASGGASLIILDIMMPQQDGWEVLQALRTAYVTRTVPILVCSVVNEPEIAFALGASDYLVKPVSADQLLSKVELWCADPLVREEVPKEAPASSEAPHPR